MIILLAIAISIAYRVLQFLSIVLPGEWIQREYEGIKWFVDEYLKRTKGGGKL